MKKIYGFLFVFLIAFLLIFREFAAVQREKTIFAMDTIINLKIRGTDKQLEEIVDIINESEDLYSAYKEGSLVYKLNDEKYIETKNTEIFKLAKEYSNLTGGAFDLSIMPITTLWGVSMENPKVPADSDVKKELEKVDYKAVEVGENFVKIGENMSVDLGGIAKGYVCDKLKAYIKENNIKYAVLDLGGNVYVLGKKDMLVGIQKPFAQRGDLLCTLSLNDKCVVTSGTYERNFKENGKVYHHIFDSKTGNPAETGISEVTIVSDSGAYADALSTALLVMGEKKAEKLYNEMKNFEYIIVKGQEVIVSDGLKEIYKEVK